MTQEALKLALEALETYQGYMEPLLTVFGGPRVPAEQSTTWKVEQAITAIKEALAQTERPADCERCNRLEDALKRANGLAEHFERAWYLRGDEIERLTAQPEQEPVAWFSPLGNLYKTRFHATANGEQVITPLYTTPQRTWVGLTDEEVDKCYYWKDRQWTTDELVRHVEAKLKQKNGYAEENT